MHKFIIFSLIHCIFCSALAEKNISAEIEALINKTDPHLNIGVKITNLDKNKLLFEKNTDRYFIPASTLKFVTIISLIEYFGLDYKFTNKLLNIGTDYYLDIHDPEFKNTNLDAMILRISAHAGKTIKGNIYISNSSFTVPAIMHSKTYSDTLYCYGGPITKVHINQNCSKLNVDITKVGQKIKVAKPKYFPYIVENKAVTIAKNILDRLHVTIKDKKYIINGTLSTNTGKVVIGAVTDNNFEHVKHHLIQRLAKNNITLKGKILYGKPKTAAKELISFPKTILEIAATALKQSDNFITDYLLAEFATKNKQIDWRHAINSLKIFIANKFNVNLTKADLQDASGISRLNLITVNQHDKFLKSVANMKNFEAIKTIMARPGEEGTLRERFKDIPKLYAKTGTLSNVSALIGYLYDKNDELHSFVIISNNFHGSNEPYRKLEEDILQMIAK